MTFLRDRKWSEREEAGALWGRLTEAWRDLRTALVSIPRLSLRTVSFTGPIASLSFEWSGTRPQGVMLVGLYRTDTGATAQTTFAWTYADNTIYTDAFAAIAATEWRASFFVIGGE